MVHPIQQIDEEKFIRAVNNTVNPLIVASMHPMLDICKEVYEEMKRATDQYGAFNSAHEGYAIILEEMDELWDHVKMNQRKRDYVAMRKEAIQLAARAACFVYDICDTENRT